MADSRQAGSLWTPEEDVALLKHVSKYGTKHWGYLQTSGVLPHRDQKACCNRFILLKRKFFQARAKGQRLTFPVVPQPPDQRPSSAQPGSPTSLRPSPTTSFKRASPSSPSSGAVTTIKRTFSGQHASGQHVSDAEAAVPGDDMPSASSYQVEKPAALRRTLARSLLQVPKVAPQHGSPTVSFGTHEAVVPSSANASSNCSLSTAPVAPKVESCLDVVCLDDKETGLPSLEEVHQVAPHSAPHSAKSFTAAPASASSFPIAADLTHRQSAPPFSTAADHSHRQQQLSTLDSLDAMTNGLPAANSIQSAMWRCFNPALVEAVNQEIEMNVDNIGLAYLDQELGGCQSMLAPDALLDHIASAPARVLFGGQSNNSAAASPHENFALPQGAALWQSTAASVADLWDLRRQYG